jgi:hypothetical protein
LSPTACAPVRAIFSTTLADKWFLSNPDYQFTLVHVPNDANTHRSSLADKLAG